MSSEGMGPGKYRAKALSHKLGKSKNNTEQVYVDFEITAGPFTGQRLGWYSFFTDKTAERTLESLEYAGWDGESLSEMRGLGSTEVELVVETERNDQDNREYLRVRWVNRVSGGPKVLLDRGQVSSLENRMKGLMLQRKQKRQAERPPRESGDDSYDSDFGPTDYGDEPPV